ncbi:MAG: hexameric tyrosine-coordinated heme protein [Dokdonella sp.]
MAEFPVMAKTAAARWRSHFPALRTAKAGFPQPYAHAKHSRPDDSGCCGKVSQRVCAPVFAELNHFHRPEKNMTDTWLKSLITATPQEGFELAITLSRRGVKYTQPDSATLKKLRPEYADSADGLTAASQVIAINFQTVAAANNYWRN